METTSSATPVDRLVRLEVLTASPRYVPFGWEIVATCGRTWRDVWKDDACCLIARLNEPLTDAEAVEFAQELAAAWNNR